MCSEKFQKVLKDDFKVLIKFFRKCQQFFISTFLKKKCPKSRRIWGMSRNEKKNFPASPDPLIKVGLLYGGGGYYATVGNKQSSPRTRINNFCPNIQE